MTAPTSRVRPGLVIAVAVAAVMLLGIVGLVVVGVVGDEQDPSGAGLDRQVDVDEPATVPERLAAVTSDASAGDAGDSAADAADDAAGHAPPSSSVPAPVVTVAAVNEIAEPAGGQQLPAAGDAPSEFPALVTTPPPPSTYPAIALAQLDQADVAELDGWTVTSRADDHVALTRGDDVVDIFAIDAIDATEALDWFYDRVGNDVAGISDSPTVRLGAPSNRFVSVAGSQFVATDAAQQGTTTISGSALAGGRAADEAVVLVISRPGTSSADQLSADGQLLRAILAHL